MTLKPVSFNDYPSLAPFFKLQPYRLCEYTLPSVIAWTNNEYYPCTAISGEFLLIGAEFNTRKENRHLLLPVSGSRIPTPRELSKIAETFGYERYCFVPDHYLEAVGEASIETFFEIIRSPEYDDYIYRTEDLAFLKGNRYSKKRNLIHQFNREFVERGRVAVEGISQANASGCIEFIEKWCEERDCDQDPNIDLACELQASVNMIENIDRADVEGLAVRVDDVISAFGVGCRLTGDMGVLHFQKAFLNIKGLYQFFDSMCARRLFGGFTYINKESDMGMPGLARAKKSYHPAMMVRAYELILR